MIPVTHMAGRRVYVFGLGRTGVSATRALVAGGASVCVWDDSEHARAGFAPDAELVAPEQVDWAALDALVLSPGVPLTHPEPHRVVKLASAGAVPIVGDTELFVEELRQAKAPSRLVGVTGTNGKSTTTALIGHLLTSVGISTQIGGNIGRSVLEFSPPVNPVVYVIELSSYQLDLTPHLKPDVAVFVNLSPDHLDRHGGMAGYVAAKAKIFANQSRGDTLVLGQDDTETAALAARVPDGVRVIPFSQDTAQAHGVWADATMLIDGTGEFPRRIADIAGIGSLRGLHNIQNAAAAAAALIALGVAPEHFSAGFETFAGLPHRMEEVGRVGRVLYINDSKATNVEAAEKALTSFANIHWIAGGRGKEGGIEALRPHFRRIEKAYLIGEAAEAFAATLVAAGVEHEIVGDLETALRAAAKGARESMGPEPVVLLSPAAASFDQYRDFEARGDAFRVAVQQLLGAEEGAR